MNIVAFYNLFRPVAIKENNDTCIIISHENGKVYHASPKKCFSWLTWESSTSLSFHAEKLQKICIYVHVNVGLNNNTA